MMEPQIIQAVAKQLYSAFKNFSHGISLENGTDLVEYEKLPEAHRRVWVGVAEEAIKINGLAISPMPSTPLIKNRYGID